MEVSVIDIKAQPEQSHNSSTSDEVGHAQQILEAFVLTSASGVLVGGTGALVLAMIGQASGFALVAVPLGLVLLSSWSCRGLWSHPHSGWDRATSLGATLALLLAVIAFSWGAFAPSHHVLIDRDPGSYVATAKWIDNEGDLRAESNSQVFGDSQAVSFASPAVYDVSDGTLEFQFMHFPSAVLAIISRITGDIGLFRAGAAMGALGLLAIYCVAVRASGRPLLALVAPGVLAISLPYVSVVRDVYSEPFALVFVWSGVLALALSRGHPSRVTSVLAGALLGATALARVDGLLVVSLAIPIVAMMTTLKPMRDDNGRRHLRFVVGALAVTMLALTDLLHFATGYASSLQPELEQLGFLAGLAVVASAVLFAAAPRLRHYREAAPVRWRQVVTVASTMAGIAFALVWLLRPYLQEARSDEALWGLIGDLQSREGQLVDLHRTYAEQSLTWFAWYLGPVTLAAALGGIALSIRRSFMGMHRPAAFITAALTVGVGAVYVLSPSITPDHVWAMRRFVPVVIPGLLIGLTVGLDAVADRLGRRPLRAVALAALVAVMAFTPLRVIASVPLIREQHGFDAVIDETCASLGDDSAVLVAGAIDRNVLPQTLRSWCGSPVGIISESTAASPSELSALANQSAEHGLALFVITSDSTVADSVPASIVRTRTQTSMVTASNRLEHTVSRRPERYLTSDEHFYIETDFRLILIELAN